MILGEWQGVLIFIRQTVADPQIAPSYVNPPFREEPFWAEARGFFPGVYWEDITHEKCCLVVREHCMKDPFSELT